MLTVCYADVSPLDDDALYRYYLGEAPEYRRLKAERYRRREDRNLCLGAGAVLAQLLLPLGLDVRDRKTALGENGKPYFPDAPSVRFNLSHSGSVVMAAVSDREVGCDVEKTGEAPSGLAKRFFHPNEYAAVLSCKTDAERIEIFYRLWTLKESYLKATGTGMSVPLGSFEIRLGSVPTLRAEGGEGFSFLEPETFDGYRSAVCVKGEASGAEIRRVSLAR